MTERKEFSKDGVLLIDGQYDKKKLRTGLWKEYYRNGIIATEELFLDGNLHGFFRSYHENGNIWCNGNYDQGHKEGKFEIYDKQGNLILFQHYNKDKLINQEILSK